MSVESDMNLIAHDSVNQSVVQNEEIWRAVSETYAQSGLEISTYGRARKGHFYYQFSKNQGGYNIISSTVTELPIHRLVALTFLPNPENKPVVDHIDRVRHNNHISNLRWATYEENAKNSVHPRKKTRALVEKNARGEIIKRWESSQLAANELNITISAIYMRIHHEKLFWEDQQDKKDEIWKPVLVYGLQFCASSYGRVKNHRGYVHFSEQLAENRYISIPITEGDFQKDIAAHRVVAQAFYPIANFENRQDLEVDHVNGIKTDNRPENLEWVTHNENMIRSFTVGKRKRKRNLVNEYDAKGQFVRTWSGKQEIMSSTNFKRHQIEDACHFLRQINGKSFRYISPTEYTDDRLSLDEFDKKYNTKQRMTNKVQINVFDAKGKFIKRTQTGEFSQEIKSHEKSITSMKDTNQLLKKLYYIRTVFNDKDGSVLKAGDLLSEFDTKYEIQKLPKWKSSLIKKKQTPRKQTRKNRPSSSKRRKVC